MNLWFQCKSDSERVILGVKVRVRARARAIARASARVRARAKESERHNVGIWRPTLSSPDQSIASRSFYRKFEPCYYESTVPVQERDRVCVIKRTGDTHLSSFEPIEVKVVGWLV